MPGVIRILKILNKDNLFKNRDVYKELFHIQSNRVGKEFVKRLHSNWHNRILNNQGILRFRYIYMEPSTAYFDIYIDI